MGNITKTRTLRPSTRQPSSSYRISTSNIKRDDILFVYIYHETNPKLVLFKYKILGSDIIKKNSIHFKAISFNSQWKIQWFCDLHVCEL